MNSYINYQEKSHELNNKTKEKLDYFPFPKLNSYKPSKTKTNNCCTKRSVIQGIRITCFLPFFFEI